MLLLYSMYSFNFTFLDSVNAMLVHRAHRLLSESTLILCTFEQRVRWKAIAATNKLSHRLLNVFLGPASTIQRFNALTIQPFNVREAMTRPHSHPDFLRRCRPAIT